jgi:hypothetical protein
MSKRNQEHSDGDKPKGEAADDDQQKARPSDHHEETMRLLEEVPWGDLENDLFDMGEMMWRAVAATAEADSWWDHAERLDYPDEFSQSEAEIKALDPEARLAYVGQLVHDLSLRLGVPATGYNGADQIVPFLERLMTTFTGLEPSKGAAAGPE